MPILLTPCHIPPYLTLTTSPHLPDLPRLASPPLPSHPAHSHHHRDEKIPGDTQPGGDPTARRKSVVEQLAENFEGEVRNPLKDLSRAELLDGVRAFQRDNDLPEDCLPYLVKGALVARDPAAFEDEGELDAGDKAALREEVTRRWHQPRALYYTIVLNSIAAAIQGWDQVSCGMSCRCEARRGEDSC